MGDKGLAGESKTECTTQACEGRHRRLLVGGGREDCKPKKKALWREVTAFTGSITSSCCDGVGPREKRTREALSV